MIRLALIGCGAHSAVGHAEPLRLFSNRHPNTVHLAACCDIQQNRAERFWQEYGFENAYSDWERMLAAEDPDAVVCAVPIEQTVPIGSEILRRKIPCVLEKPPGASLQEVATLVETARQTRTPHMISMNRRFNPFLNRALARAHETGPIHYIHGRMLRHNRREEEFIWGTGVHLIDALRSIGGEWESFDVRCVRPPQASTPWFFVSLRFASGAAGMVEIAPTAGMVEETYDLYGEGYRATVTTLGGLGEGVRFWQDGIPKEGELAESGSPSCLRDGCYEETAAFLDALRTNTALHPTVEEVAPTMELCAQINAALEREEAR